MEKGQFDPLFEDIEGQTTKGIAHYQYQYLRGRMYEHEIGVKQNDTKAVQWYLKEAEQGHAAAQYALGFCYQYWIGITIDINKSISWHENKAFEWYLKAAEQEHVAAQYALGLCYEHGIGVTKDLNKAFKWYEKAARSGDSEAQFDL